MEKFNFDLQRFESGTASLATVRRFGNEDMVWLKQVDGSYLITKDESGNAITAYTRILFKGYYPLDILAKGLPALNSGVGLLITTSHGSVQSIKLVKVTGEIPSNNGSVSYEELTSKNRELLDGIRLRFIRSKTTLDVGNGTTIASKNTTGGKVEFHRYNSNICTALVRPGRDSDLTVTIGPNDYNNFQWNILPLDEGGASRNYGVVIEGVDFIPAA